VNAGSAEGVENDDDGECDAGEDDGAAEGFVDGGVEHIAGDTGTFAADFSEAIEDDDRIVHGVAKDGQEGCDYWEADFELFDAEEAERPGEPIAGGDAGEHDEGVVGQGGDSGKAPGDVLEAEPDIGNDASQADAKGAEGAPARISRNLAADLAGRLPDDLVFDLGLGVLNNLGCFFDIDGEGYGPILERGVVLAVPIGILSDDVERFVHDGPGALVEPVAKGRSADRAAGESKCGFGSGFGSEC